MSTLTIDNIQLTDSGEYTCQPAAGPKATVMVHVLQRETEVQAVLGEGNFFPSQYPFLLYFCKKKVCIQKHISSNKVSFSPAIQL